ncbi:MAG: hypothetical protein WCJ14_01280 [Verrucomicrobiota bacterium]
MRFKHQITVALAGDFIIRGNACVCSRVGAGRAMALVAAGLLLGAPRANAIQGNAFDRILFGDMLSEAVHSFGPGRAPQDLPAAGTGAYGRGYRLTRGESGPAAHLIFTLACDPARQNYLALKCWGNDTPAEIYLQNSGDRFERAGGSPVFPDRFYYYTLPIPLNQTRGVTSVQLDLHVRESPHPLYAAYTHTAPCFEPDSEDVVGAAPARTGYREPTVPLTREQILGTAAQPGWLFKKRSEIFGPGGTLEDRMRRQVLPTTRRTPTDRVPPEVTGLDFFSNVSDLEGKDATPDQWRDRISTTKTGFAYNSFPGELLNMLTFAYLLPPFTDANGNKVAGLDRHHDPELLRRLVAALDGVSYFQGIDGGFSGTSPWIGVTSTPRATGQWAGKTGRQKSDWALLAGPSQSNLGLAIISLLNEPAAASAFQVYLKQSYDPDLGVTGADNTFTPSGRMLRAHAYERMLYHNLPYQNNIGGGTVVQRMFNILAAYSNYIALEQLLELFPNPDFAPPTDEYTRAKKMLGLLPFSTQRIDGVDYQNYELSPGGLGEAHGALSCGFDGGGYGQFVTFFAPRIAQLSFWDPKATPEVRAAMAERARTTLDGFAQYLSPADRVTVEQGRVTANPYSFCQETYITYRDAKNPNSASGSFNFDEHYVAADPHGQIRSPAALRSAYLAALNEMPPANFFYLADLPHYESTLRSLIGVNPATLTPLPGEPGQPDYAWADTRAGAVAFLNHGERFYLTANYRSDPNKGPNQDAVIHFTTPTIERACHFRLPHDAETVQPDGNLGGGSFNAPSVVRFGDYLVVLNNGAEPYPAKLPPGRNGVRELIAHTSHEPGSVVPVPPGKSAIFWLASEAQVQAGVPPKMLSVSSSATTVTGDSVELQALASDSSGDDTLTYTWFLDGHPAQPASFAQNGDNTAKRTVARFTAAGDYVIAVTVLTPDGRKACGSVKVKVLQTPKSLRIRPENPVLESGARQAFFASVEDQFKQPLQRPMPLVWSMPPGVGALSPVGLYAAPQAGGSGTIRVSSGPLAASTRFTVLAPVGVFTGSRDIGTPAVAGMSAVSGRIYDVRGVRSGDATTAYRVAGAGDDIWNQRDQFQFAALPLEGDTTLTARLTKFEGVKNGGKAALMFRSSLDPASAYVLLFANSEGGVGWEYRWGQGAGAGNHGSSKATLPVWLRITRSGNTFTAYTSSDGRQWSQLDTPLGIEAKPLAYAGLAVCSNQPDHAATATFDQVTVGGSSRHDLFPSAKNIGGSTGDYAESGTALTLTARSADVWGRADSLHFAYGALTGDGSITARLVSQTKPNLTCKAGLMVRESVDPGAVELNVSLQPAAGNTFEGRLVTASESSTLAPASAGIAAPCWLRLVRKGDTVTAFRSPDGRAWKPTGPPRQIPNLRHTLLFGAFASSNNQGEAQSAVFDNIHVTGSPNTAPTFVAPTLVAQTFYTARIDGRTASLAVLGADDAGEATLAYTWQVLGVPPGRVVFSANGDNRAKRSVATFEAPGTYYLQARLTDEQGLETASGIFRVVIAEPPPITQP